MKGLESTVAQLNGWPVKMRTRILRSAIGKGARIIARGMKAAYRSNWNVKRGQDLMQKAIGIKISDGYRPDKYGGRTGQVTARIGVRRGFKEQRGVRTRGKNKGKPFYHIPSRVAHLKEKGHGGKHPAQAHAFMQPGFEKTKAQAKTAIIDTINKGIAASKVAGLLS